MRPRFVPVDLASERASVVDLTVEYMEWVAAGVLEHVGVDLTAAFGVTVRSYVEGSIDAFAAGPFFTVHVGDALAGMGAVRQIRTNVAELKRMYIRPAFRGQGLGEALLERLADDAHAFGARTLVLDSAPFMTAAHRLYARCGFVDRAAYPETEVPEALRPLWRFMERPVRAR